MTKRIVLFCLSLVVTKSALCENIFIKCGLSESGDKAEYMHVFYAINNGPWIPVDKLDMSNSNSLSDLIEYKKHESIKFKVVTADKRFVTKDLVMPHFDIEEPHMVEIKGTTLPEEVHIPFNSVIGRGINKRLFTTDSWRKY